MDSTEVSSQLRCVPLSYPFTIDSVISSDQKAKKQSGTLPRAWLHPILMVLSPELV